MVGATFSLNGTGERQDGLVLCRSRILLAVTSGLLSMLALGK